MDWMERTDVCEGRDKRDATEREFPLYPNERSRVSLFIGYAIKFYLVRMNRTVFWNTLASQWSTHNRLGSHRRLLLLI